MKLISKNHSKEFNKLIKEARKSVKIVSPFLSDEVIDDLIYSTDCKIELITRIDFKDLLNNANSLIAIEKLIKRNKCVFSIKHLHTKLIIIDDMFAIIGSANFTNGGLYKNVELSIEINRKENEEIFEEIIDYYNMLKNTALKDKQGVITNKIIKKLKTQYKKVAANYEPPKKQLNLTSYGADVKIIEKDKSNNTKNGESIFYLINTDEKYFGDICTNEMLQYHRASAYGRASSQIEEQLKIGDVCFLYKNGKVVVACGIVNSKPKWTHKKLTNIKNGITDNYEECYVDLKNFILVPKGFDAKIPLKSRLNAVNHIKKEEKLAKKYYENLLKRVNKIRKTKCTLKQLNIKNGSKIYFKDKNFVKVAIVIRNDKNLLAVDGHKPKFITNLTKELRKKDTNVHPFDYWYLNKNDIVPLSNQFN